MLYLFEGTTRKKVIPHPKNFYLHFSSTVKSKPFILSTEFSTTMFLSLVTKPFVLVGRFPKFFNILIQFISCTVTIFLFLGCISPSSIFSGVYLVEYQFNSNSSLVAAKQNSANETDYNLKIRSGFLCKYNLSNAE